MLKLKQLNMCIEKVKLIFVSIKPNYKVLLVPIRYDQDYGGKYIIKLGANVRSYN